MIRVLGLALYGPKAASTRYRLGQYVTGLAEFGVDLDIRHLLDDEYLQRRFNGGAISWRNLVQAGWKRLSEIRHEKGKVDICILHCELFPLLPGWAEHALLPKPYIYDFDDAFYLKYRIGKLGIMRPFLGEKFDRVMQGAAAVTAGNAALANYAIKKNGKVYSLPTVVDTRRYVPEERLRNKVFTVGWIGSPSTAPYLNQLVEPLSLIGKEGPVRFVVIGGNAPSIPNVTVNEIEWNENTEVALINTFDVGLMPLPDDDWARGKCAFKLIQYMACAVPVIASRVGANIEVVQPECGFLASNLREWLDALRFYRDRPEGGRKMGEAGRNRVEQNYSLHRNLPILAELICKTVQESK